ncbi:MAG: hydrogenase nickel incorporation protein HypB [Eubacterium sp.]|nr:hydrogenase nickel incorporation protein HypB [Eubacterium sp.]
MNKREIDILDVKSDVIADNDREAGKVRKYMREKKVFLVNLMASPGAGKTTTLVRTINALKDKYRIGVMEADVDSDVDAATVQAAGAKVIQLHTGGSCHMDANMTFRGIEQLGMEDIDVLFLENIGNLVCPAEFDVGAAKRVAILSVPEGDDKPLKYPLMFQVCDLLMIGKIDVKPVFNFDEEACRKYVRELNPTMPVIPVSAKTGEGFDAWIDWLTKEIEAFRAAEV